jgi:acyl-CoA ligase (AMP-forming) (exosortase A-associated)
MVRVARRLRLAGVNTPTCITPEGRLARTGTGTGANIGNDRHRYSVAAAPAEAVVLADLLTLSARRSPSAPALTYGEESLSYAELQARVQQFAAALLGLGLARGERVGIYLEKRLEAVVASFGCAAAGTVLVPINPLLKPDQVAFILQDCNVRLLVTSPPRRALLAPVLTRCLDLRLLLLTDSAEAPAIKPVHLRTSGPALPALLHWPMLAQFAACPGHRVLDTDMAAILYTSGSTGSPKGVVLSHRNMVVGAKSVAGYLGNHAQDTLLAALPLSFDAGFSQLTTAFHAGARVVLLNYLLAREVLNTLVREAVTGLTAVPPLYIQLAQLDWPREVDHTLRYFANTGGRLPGDTLNRLRLRVPSAKPFLMYGLTEAFRSTYLPPEEVERRPDSIGRAIPNAEILVLRADGSPCAPDEPGELVHRGALVGLGYWNDAARTAERYKPLPAGAADRQAGLVLPEYAVFSGDTVRQDAQGFLYYVGRRDDMIKTSGYRVSPTEIEELVYATQLVGECVAFGVPHPVLGQAIQLIATVATPTPHTAQEQPPACDSLLQACRLHMPGYMVPAAVQWVQGPLPRNPNGKLDRAGLISQWRQPHGT